MVLDTIGHMKFSLSWVTEVHDKDFEAEVHRRYWTEVWSWFCSWKIVNLRELKFSPDFAAKVWWKFRSWSLINNLKLELSQPFKAEAQFSNELSFRFQDSLPRSLVHSAMFHPPLDLNWIQISRKTNRYWFHCRKTIFCRFSPVNSLILNVSSEFLCASLVCLSPKNRLRDKGEPKCVW